MEDDKPMFAAIEEAVEEIRAGRIIVVVDDDDRENEGDLVMAADLVTPERVNFMATHGRGLICSPVVPETAERLDLKPMVQHNQEKHQTAFTVSVDAAKGIATGISASDRARTIRLLASPESRPGDLVRPGHVFPLVAREGGVLKRAGHTEAAADLARLAGLNPAGVICEVMKEDGTMARLPELRGFAQTHGLKIIQIRDLIRHRMKTERIVRKVAEARMPTRYGVFKAFGYESLVKKEHHVALVMGDIRPSEPTLVRVHSECLTGDVFHSLRCDCGEQLERAVSQVAAEGRGVVLYLRQEGRGIGLINKLRAYEIQDGGADTVEANEALGFPPDLRDYGTGAQILVDLGVRKMRLLTNNNRKIVGLDGYGLEVVERVPLVVKPNDYNVSYLKTKKTKLGHDL